MAYTKSHFVKETLKDCLCETLKELEMSNWNEEGSKKAILQCDEMVGTFGSNQWACVTILNVLNRWHSLFDGMPTSQASFLSSSFFELGPTTTTIHGLSF